MICGPAEGVGFAVVAAAESGMGDDPVAAGFAPAARGR